MKEPNWSDCDEQTMWTYVAWHLQGDGISSVLVGGAVVAIYTDGLYQSNDLDIIADDFKRAKVDGVLQRIGFERTKSRYYRHPNCDHLVVEFPPGPVSLGEQIQIEPDEVEIEGRTILILSPTDCIKDRLASYIHWKTRDCFDQAVLVYHQQKDRVNLEEVRRWCCGEGSESTYLKFKKAL